MSVQRDPLLRLSDLVRERDEEWERFCQIPREEVRAYWDQGQPEGRIADSFARTKSLGEQIAAHPDWRDFEADLREALGERMKNASVAGQVYSALCNVDWTHEAGTPYSCSWRYAGGLVAEIRDQGEDYMDFYCGGNEGHVSEVVDEALAGRGWSHD